MAKHIVKGYLIQCVSDTLAGINIILGFSSFIFNYEQVNCATCTVVHLFSLSFYLCVGECLVVFLIHFYLAFINSNAVYVYSTFLSIFGFLDAVLLF